MMVLPALGVQIYDNASFQSATNVIEKLEELKRGISGSNIAKRVESTLVGPWNNS